MTLSEPRWTDAFEQQGRLDVVNVYTGDVAVIEDVAFLAYATPRAPEDALYAALLERGVKVRRIGDCLNARALLAATSEGHAAGNAV